MGLGASKILFVSSNTGYFVFPMPPGSLIIKSHWPLSRPDSLDVPSSFVSFPSLKGYNRVQNLHNSVITSLVLLFSSLWVPVGMGFDFIGLCPFYCLTLASSLSLDKRHHFGGFQHPPAEGCSIASCSFGGLKEEMSIHPSTLPFEFAWLG